MRIQVDYPDASRAVAISIERDDATVTDLTRELGLDDAAISVDGVVHLPETPLREIAMVDGSRISSLGGGTGRSSLGNVWLGVVNGPGAGAMRTLDSTGNVLIGRDPNAGLPINSGSVSQTQTVVERLDGESFTVQDLESLNGTWVRGKSISKVTPLAMGEPSGLVRRRCSCEQSANRIGPLG